MRADIAAAYLDHKDTSELQAAVTRGEAPPPTSLRGTGRRREPVWSKASLDRFLAPAEAPRQYVRPSEHLADLVA
jgi:hypothetical protein